MKRLTFLLVFFSFSFAYGQMDTSLVRSNPYECIYNHLFYLQSDSYDPERSSLSLPDNSKDKIQNAIKLKQILDGKGLYIDVNRIPKDSNYTDSLSNDHIYLIDKTEQQIYLELTDIGWTYSRTTIESIDDLYNSVYPFGTQFVSNFKAPYWQVKILSIKLWKWLGLLIVLTTAYVVFFLVRLLSKYIIVRILKKKMSIDDNVNKPLYRFSRVMGLILAIRYFLYFLPMFQLAPKYNAILIKGLNILSLFLLLFALNYLLKILLVYMQRLTSYTESSMDDQLLPVVYKLLSLILWSIGIIYILDYMGVNITALLAGISIGGLALALAAQDTVKNFFGSIMIFLDKPFQIGDLVEFDGVLGTIEEVGVRATRIRTPKNSLTYVPNAKIADSIINNLGMRVYRQYNTNLGITYDSSPESIELFVKGLREIIIMHPHIKDDNFEVHLNSFGDSSINIMMNMYFDTKIWSEELKYRHEVMIAIIKLAEGMGIRFAFPTRTLHIEEMPKAGSLTPDRKSSAELSMTRHSLRGQQQ